MTRAEIARQRLLSNLKTLTEDVEELMKATAEQADDGLSSLRGQVRRTLQSIRDQLIQKEDILKEARHVRCKRCSRKNETIRNHRLASGITSWFKSASEGKSPHLPPELTATSHIVNGFHQRWVDLGLCVYQD